MFNFGQTANTQPASTSAFNFGGSTAAQPQSTSAFNFGGASTTQPQSSSAFSFGGGFGSSATAAPTTGAAPSFSLFGGTQPAASQPQQQSASSFSQPQQQQQPQAFGTQPQQGFGAQPQQQFQTQYGSNALAAAAPTPYPLEPIRAIKDAYNPQSPNCQFQTFFYTKVDPTKIDQYVKPLHISNRRWLLAQKQNPDPTTLVPVHAVGFQDLHKRIQQQQKASEQLRAQLQQIVSSVDDLQHTFVSSTLSSLQTAARQHTRLQHRLLKLSNKIQLLRTHDVPFMTSEMEYGHKLQELQQNLSKPAALQTRAKEYATIAQHTVQQLQSQHQLHQPQQHTKLDPQTEQDLYTLLDTHRQALAHSTNVMRVDAADIKVVQQYQQQQEQSTMRSQLLLQ